MVDGVNGGGGWMYFAAGEAADWDDHFGGSREMFWDVESLVDGVVGF